MEKRRVALDEFVVVVGKTISGENYVCATTRKGARDAEPLDVHEIGRWLISCFGLREGTRARLLVCAELLEEDV